MPFNHKDEENTAKGFIGRERLKAKMFEFLKNGGERGVFLVTGYRGMGKTSFVHHVLKDFIEWCKEQKGHKTKVKVMDITFAQNNLNEEYIIRNIVSRLYEFERIKYEKSKKCYEERKKPVLTCIRVALTLLIIPVLILIFPEKADYFLTFKSYHTFLNGLRLFGIGLSFVITFYSIYLLIINKTKREKSESFQKIERIHYRCYSSFSMETQEQDELELSIPRLPFRSAKKESEKSTYNYPIATIKEVEHELEEYLIMKKKENKIRYIFIFDELDKIELTVLTTSYFDDLPSFENNRLDTNYLQQLRKRKQTIINTIAGLKSFLTRVDATFFFIAGREMFDASLADISDREASISSIFTYVFYVESFFKESAGEMSNTSLSKAIENYLGIVLLNKKSNSLLKDIANKVSAESIDEKNKIIVFLQNFIIYLTYRSNGSPKKLIRAIHEFIRIEDNLLKEEIEKGKTTLENLGNTGNRYLYFNFNDQYRIGFINFLYRPFLIRYGKNFKHFSDSIIAATPYLFDHLLKFHPFAFSFKNLEMIPEVLSTNKTESLKEHIQKIVDYLYNGHIRETEIGLFEYKFYSRVVNDLTFISKTFEEESAAFNFTLDESYLVKLHIRTKIKELRSIYSRFKTEEKVKYQTFSIFNLNMVLGDLHFFDQEYDDAITAYSDAINPIGVGGGELSYLDFTTLLTVKLKLGLTFEKIASYEDALSYYTDATDIVKKFVVGRLNDTLVDRPEQIISGLTTDRTALRGMLQIVNQSFLSKLSIEEKRDMNGISTTNLMTALTDFLSLSSQIEQHTCKYHMIHTNFLLVLGNMLFFKNACREIDIDVIKKFNTHAETKALADYFEKFNNNSGKRSGGIIAISLYTIGLEQVFASVKKDDIFNQIKQVPPSKLTESILSKCLLLVKDENIKLSKINYRYIAILLSNIGNCILAMPSNSGSTHEEDTDKKEDHGIEFTSIWDREKYKQNELKNNNDHDILFSGNSDFFEYIRKGTTINPISTVLRYYYLSAICFLKAGRSTTSNYQLKKILYVLRMVLPTKYKNVQHSNEFLSFLEHWILNPIFQISSKIAEFSDSHMTNKLKDLLLGQPADKHFYIQNNISNHPETREATMLFSYIKLKLTNQTEDISKQISQHNSVASQFTRLLELDLYQKLSYIKIKKLRESISSGQDLDLYLQENVNYLYSLVSIIRTLSIYGISYTISYNYMAYAHLHIANWLFEENEKKQLTETEVESILEQVKLIAEDKSTAVLHDAIWHFKMARANYEKAIQLHIGGHEYKNAMNNLIYLEDDFNDNAFHFGAAMERHLLMNRAIHREITNCNKALYKLTQKEQI